MSGHSKWSSIKHKKAATDAKRGKTFTKLAKAISIAAREGGGDPNANIRLRLAVDTAKKANMPNDNIDRAIKRGTGEIGGDQIEQLTLEAFGPGGIGLIVEAITDNKNRTLSDVRTILSKNGGTSADLGAVSHGFAQKGVIRAELDELTETQEEAVIESGAQDYDFTDNTLTITTERADLKKVEEVMKSSGIDISEGGLEFVPKSTIPIESETEEKLLALLSALDDNDDVVNVKTNAQGI